jgi:ferritin-like metal-binding protein YciE
MANKDNQELMQKYVSDQLALEKHVNEAISGQMNTAKQDPEANTQFTQFVATLKGHISSLEARLTALGGNPASPIKEVGAAVLGTAAAVIDKVRADEISKNLRDDYTALNLSIISYLMLHATATAVGDSETADLAQRFAKDHADFVMWINKNISRFVVKELQDSGASLDMSAQNASQTIQDYVWGQ